MKLGETGVFPVGNKLVAVPLTMPMTRTDLGSHLNITMSDNSGSWSQKSHTQKIRETYDTEDLGAIMSRFYDAVSFGGER